MKWLFQISVACLITYQTISYDYNNVPEPTEPCPSSLGYHPGDENWTTLICDCIDDDKQLYYPATESCYFPYFQGPCPPENYLVLPPEDIEAKCVKNPCLKEGLVLFNGICHFLGSSEPCEQNNTYLKVEEYTFELKCMEPEFSVGGIRSSIYGTIISAPLKECRKGSRRIFTGRCKREFE